MSKPDQYELRIYLDQDQAEKIGGMITRALRSGTISEIELLLDVHNMKDIEGDKAMGVNTVDGLRVLLDTTGNPRHEPPHEAG